MKLIRHFAKAEPFEKFVLLILYGAVVWFGLHFAARLYQNCLFASEQYAVQSRGTLQEARIENYWARSGKASRSSRYMLLFDVQTPEGALLHFQQRGSAEKLQALHSQLTRYQGKPITITHDPRRIETRSFPSRLGFTNTPRGQKKCIYRIADSNVGSVIYEK